MLAEIFAPVAPEAGWIVVGLGLFVAWFALWGLKQGYYYSLGALLREVAKLVGKILLVGGIAASGIERADHWVLAELATGIAGVEAGMAKWWHGMEWLVRFSVDSMVGFAHDVHAAFDNVVHGTIPSVVSNTVKPLVQATGHQGAALARLARTLTHDLRATAIALEREIELDFGKAWRGIDHLRGSLAGALAHGLAVAQAGIDRVSGYVHGILNARLGVLARIGAVGFSGAAALAIVSRVWPWLRCSNVNKLGRAACRMPSELIDALLGAGLAVLVWSDLCEISRGIELVAKRVEPEIRRLVVVAGAATSCWPPQFDTDPPINGVVPPTPTNVVPYGSARLY